MIKNVQVKIPNETDCDGRHINVLTMATKEMKTYSLPFDYIKQVCSNITLNYSKNNQKHNRKAENVNKMHEN